MKFKIHGGPRDGEEVTAPYNLATLRDDALRSVIGKDYVGWRSPRGSKPGVIAYYGGAKTYSQIERELGPMSTP